MFKLIRDLNEAFDANQKAAQRLTNTVDDCIGRPCKIPEPIKKVSTDHQSYARPA